MKAGGEFLFWLILFAEILGAWGIYELINLALKLRDARRRIARLTVELARHEAWMRYRSQSERPRRMSVAR